MTNLNAMTTNISFNQWPTHELLKYSEWIMSMRQEKLTQRGNDCLIEIDAELESRQPVGEFRTLYDIPENWYTIHSFFCGRAYRGCDPKLCPKDVYERTGIWIGSKVEIVGFEVLTLEGDDNWNQWEDYGISPATFMGQY